MADEIIIEGDTQNTPPIETHTIHDHCEHCTEHAERLILIEQQIAALTRVAEEVTQIEEAQQAQLNMVQEQTILATDVAFDAMNIADSALEEATSEPEIQEEIKDNGSTDDTISEETSTENSNTIEPVVIRVEPEQQEKRETRTRFHRGKR